MALLYPVQVSTEGITTNVLGQEVTFKFLMPQFSKEINLLKGTSTSRSINIITREKLDKKKLLFLKQELNYKSIEEQLKKSIITIKD